MKFSSLRGRGGKAENTAKYEMDGKYSIELI